VKPKLDEKSKFHWPTGGEVQFFSVLLWASLHGTCVIDILTYDDDILQTFFVSNRDIKHHITPTTMQHESALSVFALQHDNMKHTTNTFLKALHYIFHQE